MHHKNVPTGFKLIVFFIPLIAFYPLMFWFGRYTLEHTKIWQALARMTGSDDLQGTILMSLAAINIIMAIVVYKVVVRAVEKKLNLPAG